MKDSGGESALYWYAHALHAHTLHAHSPRGMRTPCMRTPCRYRGDQLLKHKDSTLAAAPSSASSAAASGGSVLKPLPKCGPARRLDSRRARQTALPP